MEAANSMTTTTAPPTTPELTTEQRFDKVREAYAQLRLRHAELQTKQDESEQRITDLENRQSAIDAKMQQMQSQARHLRTVLNRDPVELMYCPKRIDRIEGQVGTLMADLHKREAAP